MLLFREYDCLFFFKQKTAYDMRISDWSSDVCSSDLMIEPGLPKGTDGKVLHPISASALKPVAAQFNADGKPFKMGMVFPVSTHNSELRYWLAAGGLKDRKSVV